MELLIREVCVFLFAHPGPRGRPVRRGAVPLAVLVLALLLAASAAARERGVVLQPSGPAEGEARLALVIGNGDYEGVPLRNPVNDANDMADVLQELGFTVMLHTDVGRRSMIEAISRFGERLRGGGVGLFYYAGHGVQVDGRNFLIPIGASIRSRADVPFEAVDMGRALAMLDEAGNRLNIMILDACRDNPFRGFRGGTRGLAKTDAPRGTIVAYATAPGSVAADGDGRNGVYTQHLLQAIEQPGLPIEQVFKRVRIAVVEDTDGDQTPWESSSLTGEFFFQEPDPEDRPPATLTAILGLDPGRRFDTEDMVEKAREAWNERLERMRKAHADARAYESGPAPPALKAQVWERFLGTFPEDHPESDEDDRLRARAEERVAHWKEEAGRDQAPEFGMDDLLEQARAARAERLGRMRAAFEDAEVYEEGQAPSRLKQQAWERFLQVFPDDPSTGDDDAMRRHATQQVAHWQARPDAEPQPYEPPPRPAPAPPVWSDDEEVAARQALEEYRASYEARDLERLSRIWIMNPDQREAIRILFDCAEEVRLEIDEEGLTPGRGAVSIEFEQRLAFSGPRCMARSDGEATRMIATLIQGSEGWMISSILPRLNR